MVENTALEKDVEALEYRQEMLETSQEEAEVACRKGGSGQ